MTRSSGKTPSKASRNTSRRARRKPRAKSTGKSGVGTSAAGKRDHGKPPGAPQGPSSARKRATARALRRSGEVAVKTRFAVLAVLGIFVAGGLSGGLLGSYLERQGGLTLVGGESPAVLAAAQPSEPAITDERLAEDLIAQKLEQLAAEERAAAVVQEEAANASIAAVAAVVAELAPSAGPENETSAAETPAIETSAEPAPEPEARPVVLVEPAPEPEPPPVVLVEAAPELDPAMLAPVTEVQAPAPEPSEVVSDVDGRATVAEVRVVYEEPITLAQLLPPPSEQGLEGFVQQTELATAAPAPTEPTTGPRLQAWQRNAVQGAAANDRPMIAMVLDDLGLNRANTWRIIEMPGPLTLSFMTYAEDLQAMLGKARQAGHELLVHMPMEPNDDKFDPGPRVLRKGLGSEELIGRIKWGLGRFDGFVGVNNHMGSKFTSSPEGMAVVMNEIKQRGLLYLDSKTSNDSVSADLAKRVGVPYAERDIFIDNDPDNPDSIRRQLALLEAIARRRGYAVGIGHPRDGTVAVLKAWLSEVEGRGFQLVPISAVVRHRIDLARVNGRAG